MRHNLAKAVIFLTGYSLSAMPGHAQTDDTIPPNFRGKITYEGTQDGTAVVQAGGNSRIRVFGISANIQNTQTVPFHSRVHQEVEFEGDTYRGSQTIRGAAANGTGTFTGIRHGDTCDSVNDDGRHWVSRCTLSAFVGDEQYVNPQGQRIKAHTDVRRIDLVDYVERDRRSSAAPVQQVKIAQSAAPAARSAAPAARVSAAKVQSSAQIPINQQEIFTKAAEAFKRYIISQKSSDHNYRIESKDDPESGPVSDVTIDYLLPNGEEAWTKMTFIVNHFYCLRISQDSNLCRNEVWQGHYLPVQGEAFYWQDNRSNWSSDLCLISNENYETYATYHNEGRTTMTQEGPIEKVVRVQGDSVKTGKSWHEFVNVCARTKSTKFGFSRKNIPLIVLPNEKVRIECESPDNCSISKKERVKIDW